MREFDVTPQNQSSDCIYQANCQYYKYGIYCNECSQRRDFDEVDLEDED